MSALQIAEILVTIFVAVSFTLWGFWAVTEGRHHG